MVNKEAINSNFYLKYEFLSYKLLLSQEKLRIFSVKI